MRISRVGKQQARQALRKMKGILTGFASLTRSALYPSLLGYRRRSCLQNLRRKLVEKGEVMMGSGERAQHATLGTEYAGENSSRPGNSPMLLPIFSLSVPPLLLPEPPRPA
jgi:hypothetical protein